MTTSIVINLSEEEYKSLNEKKKDSSWKDILVKLLNNT